VLSLNSPWRHASRTLGAITVILTTIGCAPPGPVRPVASVESLRQNTRINPPSNTALSYLIAGNSQAPRLILIHGTPGSADAWADYLLDLPPGLEVLALDRPGFGQSGPVGAVVSLEKQAAAVVALLATDDRPSILLGHSLGGPIAAWVAATHPEKVSALILLAASMDPALEEIHPLQPIGQWAWVHALLPRKLRNANSELMALKPQLKTLGTMLEQIKAPTMIVHGTQDNLVPVANVSYMQAKLNNSRCLQTRLLPGQNHFLPWNSANEVRLAIDWAVKQSTPMNAAIANESPLKKACP
jgi:pimeloyl-ACP methyl ester carboxylesterase